MPWWVPLAEHFLDAATVLITAYFASKAGMHARRARRLVDSMYPPDFPPPSPAPPFDHRRMVTPRERR